MRKGGEDALEKEDEKQRGELKRKEGRS